jgi:hypothetical protein
LVSTPEFWGYMVGKGSRVYRHTGTKISAWKIMENFTGSKVDSSVVLDIQREMVTEHKNLDETSAGVELNKEILQAQAEARKIVEEVEQNMKIAMEERDKEMQQILEEERMEAARNMEKLMLQQENLKISLESLHETKRRELEEKLRQQQDSHAKQLRDSQRKQEALEKQMPKLRFGDYTSISDLVKYQGRFKSPYWVTYGTNGSYIAKDNAGEDRFL